MNIVLSYLYNTQDGVLFLHCWECQQQLEARNYGTAILKGDGIIDSGFTIHSFVMSRVLKPFYNTAVSLFYSLTKITNYIIKVKNIFQFSFTSAVYKSVLCRPTNQLEVICIAFLTPFFPQVLINKGSKNGYCSSNICFIKCIFLLVDVKIWY